MGQLAQHALGQDLAGALPLRVMDDHEGLGRDQPRRIAGGDQLVEFGFLHRDGLFDQNRVARGQGPFRPFHMKVVRQRDIDGINAGMGQQFVIAVEHAKVRGKGLERGGFFGR